ncbi:MAG: RraA family protein [Planctomycetes bacterium]|nr:RraA family protein [Planctomycetota bacterium]
MDSSQLLSAEELALLRRFDTPTVCNVIELFDVRPRNAGYMDGRIKANFPKFPPMVGYATTATFRSAAPPRGQDATAGMEGQLAAFAQVPDPRVVVFQDLDDPPAAATFGEVMCTTYKTFGCAGLITSGAGRDLLQVEALGFPVFTGQTICAHAYCHILGVNLPVHVGGITVYPGDLLHGDANGVTTIPLDIARSVARTCEEFVAAEEVILKCLRTRGPDLRASQEARQECQRRIRELGERVRRQSAR